MLFLAKHDRDWRRFNLPGTSASLPADLQLRRFCCPLPDASLAGKTLLFFSDIHWCGRNAARLRALVEVVNNLAPDWIVFGGDLIRFMSDVPGVLPYLGDLQAKQGKIAVRGNRESVHYWQPVDFWRKSFAEVGFSMLVNEVLTSAESGGIHFVGLDDLRHGDPDLDLLAQTPATSPAVITVSHTPDTVGHQSERFLGHLVLAGHTHGGQLRIPGVGPLYTSSVYGKQFDRGWFERVDGTLMYVTAGIGETGRNLLRRRLFCPAEAVLMEFIPVTRT